MVIPTTFQEMVHITVARHCYNTFEMISSHKEIDNKLKSWNSWNTPLKKFQFLSLKLLLLQDTPVPQSWKSWGTALHFRAWGRRQKAGSSKETREVVQDKDVRKNYEGCWMLGRWGRDLWPCAQGRGAANFYCATEARCAVSGKGLFGNCDFLHPEELREETTLYIEKYNILGRRMGFWLR